MPHVSVVFETSLFVFLAVQGFHEELLPPTDQKLLVNQLISSAKLGRL
jgi:hypothetical protein